MHFSKIIYHSLHRVVILSLLHMILLGTPASAASFDCDNAKTAIEINICGNDTLSKIDELIAVEYSLIDYEKPVAPNIKSYHLRWLKELREAVEYSMQSHLETLKYLNLVNECWETERPHYASCPEKISNRFSQCMEEKDWTSWGMNLCGFSLARSYRVLLENEISRRSEVLSDDPETLQLFNEANTQWESFVDADCDWQWSEFRDGTISGQIQSGCLVKHLENRLTDFTSEKW